jgi:hypothetical protein
MSNKHANEPRESFRVTFVIQGLSLDFEAISRALNITPTHTHRTRDLSKTKRRFPHDMWSLTSPLMDQQEPFDAHLKWLADQLKPNYDFIKSLKSSAEVYIRCGYTTEREQSGFTLSPEALTILTDLGISLDVSILSI